MERVEVLGLGTSYLDHDGVVVAVSESLMLLGTLYNGEKFCFPRAVYFVHIVILPLLMYMSHIELASMCCDMHSMTKAH